MSEVKENMFIKPIVYSISEMKDVIVRENISYADQELVMDLYYLNSNKELKPAVIFITGYPDPGFKAMTGYKLKETAQYRSWEKLVAASGFVAITYANRDPQQDIKTLLSYIRENAESLQIDAAKLAILSYSGNTPNAFSLLLGEYKNQIKCAVFGYGFMPDLGESTYTADAAKQFYFVNPPIENIDIEMPILIVRAGQDQIPGTNKSINQFVGAALEANLPISLVNLPNAVHAFDIMDDQESSRNAIKSMVEYVKLHLS